MRIHCVKYLEEVILFRLYWENRGCNRRRIRTLRLPIYFEGWFDFV